MVKKIVIGWVLGMCVQIHSAQAKDLALIFAYDCEDYGQFGSALNNEIVVLENFGWNVRYYCGNEAMSFQENGPLSSRRAGSFREENVLGELNRLPSNTNILVIFNTHGGPANYVQRKDNGDQIIALGQVEFFNDLNYMWVSSIMKRLTEYQRKNPDSFVFHVNDSCYSGRSVLYIEEDSEMCSISMAPEDEVGYSNNYWEMAFQSLPGSPGNFMRVSGEADNAFDYMMGKKYSDGYLRDMRSLSYESSSVSDIIKTPLWFDRTTISFYSHGFGLNQLNISDNEEFLARYKKLAGKFSDKSKLSASMLIAKFEKLIDELPAMMMDESSSSDAYQQNFRTKYWAGVENVIRKDRIAIYTQMESCTIRKIGEAISCTQPTQNKTEMLWELFNLESSLENWFFNDHDFTQSCFIDVKKGELGQEKIDRMNSIITDPVCNAINQMVSAPHYQEEVTMWRKLKKQREFENLKYNLTEFYNMKKFDQNMEYGMIRNQMMALALSETPSKCGRFNLDRRSGI